MSRLIPSRRDGKSESRLDGINLSVDSQRAKLLQFLALQSLGLGADKLKTLQANIGVTPDLTLQIGYRLALQGKHGQVLQAGKFVGKETANLSAMGFINEERDVVVTRKELRGRTLAQAAEMLDLRHRFGVYATRLRRLDQEIPMYLSRHGSANG